MPEKYSRQSLESPAPELPLNPKREEPTVGTSAAVIYALVAHKLSTFYDEGYWFTQAQAATLCIEWLMRSSKVMSLAERKHLADLSDQVALQIRNTLSREAGLFTAHELMESLDANYASEIGASIMEECVRALKNSDISQAPATDIRRKGLRGATQTAP